MEKEPTDKEKEEIQLNPSQTKTIKTKTYEFFVNDNEQNKTNYKHKDNSIDTTKYNLITFLPKALLFQFFRLANIYFLCIAIIQSIDQISPLGKETAWAPLAFVLCVSLIREAVEDIARYKYDKILNSEPVTVYRKGEWVEAQSGDLQIGELIIVKQDSTLPADMVLLDSNLKEGVAFIETGTLDGEKALKQKIGPKGVAGFFNESGHWKSGFEVKGNGSSDSPNPNLYELDCKLYLTLTEAASGERKEVQTPCNARQLLLKGAKLRNTKWIIGLVLYTGHNNKLILNSEKPRMKYSRIEYLMSNLLIVILILQAVFCIITAALYSLYYTNNIESNPFMPKHQFNGVVDSVLTYFTYTLLLNTMIPISLIITLEIVKLIQGYFLSVDVEGYSFVRKQFIKAASVSLNEELGQVNFIFSDKTGTLTCNKMNYKYGVIGDVCYEFVRDEESEVVDEEIVRIKENHFNPGRRNGGDGEEKPVKFNMNSHRNVNKTSYPGYRVMSEYNPNSCLQMDSEDVVADEYWKALAVCHQCEIEENEQGEKSYVAPSPDDVELVKTAALQGYELRKSPVPSIRRISIGGVETDFELLHTIEFDSTRKRMSVVVREGESYKLYIKGADTAIEWIGRVEEGNSRVSMHSNKVFLDQAKRYMEFFSLEGYRTLLLGMKVLDKEEYLEWDRKLHEAGMRTEGKKEAIETAYAEVEKNIYILGATIVEDKLQDKVPETIHDLRLAGIKVWMLTGDKIDTAYNIGLNCNLVSHDLKIFKLHGEKGDRLNKLLEEYEAFRRSFPKDPFSILIDAVALAIVLDEEERVKSFLDIAYHAKAVICCRVSPKQKSQVVKMVKDYDKNAVTLAIGDGGNDVSMITQAHIGIGMYGEEGMRAVQSGDYALGEFKLLSRLLFFHGRTNNLRVSKMILYFFYKNFVFTITHFYFAFYNNFTGQTIIDDWFITFYNLLFTAFPLGAMAVIDFDLILEDGAIVKKMLPFLYEENMKNPMFTKLSFIISMLRGIVHSLINFFFLVFILGVDNSDAQGNMPDLWFFSVCCFTNIIFIVSFRICLIIKYQTILNWLILTVLSWILYILFIIVMHNGVSNSIGTMLVTFSGAKFYLSFILIVGTCAMIDHFTSSFDFLFKSSIASVLKIKVKELGKLDSDESLPKIVKEKLKLAEKGLDYLKKKKEDEKESGSNGVIIVGKKANEVDLEKVDGVHISSNRSRNQSQLPEPNFEDEEKRKLSSSNVKVKLPTHSEI